MRDGGDAEDGDGVGGRAKKGQGATERGDDASLLPIPDQETEIHSSRKKRKRTKMRKRMRPEKRSDRPMMREGELSSLLSSNLEVVRGSKGDSEGDVVTWARPCWRWLDGWWSAPGLQWRHSDFWGVCDRLACATARDVDVGVGGEGLVSQSNAVRVRPPGDTCAFGEPVPGGRVVGDICRARVLGAGVGVRIGGAHVAGAAVEEEGVGNDLGCCHFGLCCEPALSIIFKL